MEQTRAPMDKNRIGGKPCGTSGLMTTKSGFIKRTVCKFGGGVRKAVELTSGDLPLAVETRLGIE